MSANERGMKADYWERIQELFHLAADLPREQQERFLDTECVDDRDLRAEVESLLTSDRKRGA
ncbi:MAG TPA: hypothetical protein VKS01_03335, partial [Bryobacteraceae bacterium]|nr:hypothetical protein [Bryobacteraceae bacterium]